MAILEVKFESSINEVVGKNNNTVRMSTLPSEILVMQSEELKKNSQIYKEENGCDEKNVDVPEEVTLAKTSH